MLPSFLPLKFLLQIRAFWQRNIPPSAPQLPIAGFALAPVFPELGAQCGARHGVRAAPLHGLWAPPENRLAAAGEGPHRAHVWAPGLRGGRGGQEAEPAETRPGSRCAGLPPRAARGPGCSALPTGRGERARPGGVHQTKPGVFLPWRRGDSRSLWNGVRRGKEDAT